MAGVGAITGSGLAGLVTVVAFATVVGVVAVARNRRPHQGQGRR
jgi:hypothetical protein